MIAAALLMLFGQQAVAAPAPAGWGHCLPDQSGFLSMRLRGSIEADIQWRDPELDCAGMPRPDGRGLRLRFAGSLPGNRAFAIIFAAPELGRGVSARSVAVNVTLIDGAGERIYGTQGNGRCQFDAVEQRPLSDAALPPHTYQVNARGFCTAPARALDGSGAVLLTRFDFAGRVTFQDDDGVAPPAELAGMPLSEVQVETASGRHVFKVWIANDDRSRRQGLMFIKQLPADHGMLFLFERPELASFWMKNTYVSLDIVFIGPDGIVVNIAHDAQPLSLAPIQSVAPVSAVLELAAGTAARIGLVAGDRVQNRGLITP